MSITRLQQARQMYATGQRVAKTLDGSRPGYAGPAGGASALGNYGGDSSGGTSANEMSGAGAFSGADDRREQASVASTMGLPTPSPQAVSNIVNEGPLDLSSDLQKYMHQVATNTNLPPQLQPPIQLKKRELAFQNFLDYRKPVQTFGISGLFKKPIQSFSDWSASINRPFFEKVIRAGKIPGLSFDMTQQQFENAYQNYMSNRLAGKTDAYGNPMQGFEYGDDNILTGQFQDDGGGGGGNMDVVDDTTDDTTDDTNEDGSLVLRYLHDYPDEVVNLQAMGVQDTDEMLQLMLNRAKNLYTT